MLEYFLRKFISYPLLRHILNYGVYYPLIFAAILTGLVGIYRRLAELGYEKDRIRRLFILLLAVTYPAAIVSARAANMFYYPRYLWSFQFFTDQFINGRFVTFHAGFFLPLVIIGLIVILMKMKFWEVFDTLFLYIPLGHAIGRVACFLVGCCWGNPVSVNLFGKALRFNNPIPLYSILLNLAIFFILRKIYRFLYKPQGPKQLSGIIVSLYLILYGNVRLLLELFRKEMIVSWGLTQAQIIMIAFIVVGSLLFIIIALKNRVLSLEEGPRLNPERELYLLCIAGFVLYYLVTAGLTYYLLSNRIISWPFHRLNSTAEAYATIVSYLPFFGISLLSILFLKKLKLPILSSFRWEIFSRVFFIGLAGSFGYLLYALVPIRFGIYNYMFWPPVIILSILNALSEEIIYRLVFFRILGRFFESSLIANLIQSLFYSGFHFAIGGIGFGFASLIYGFILGIVMEKNQSIVPCLICHFIIDLGAIGAPLLIP